MTEPYYNISYGKGLEGLLNYGNELVSGWMANAFLGMIFIIATYTGSKSEWKMSSVLSFSCLITLLSSFILKLFMNVNEYVIFLFAAGLGISIFWSVVENR